MTNNNIQSTNEKNHAILKLLALAFSIIALMLLQFSTEISLFVENSLAAHMIVEHSIFFLTGYVVAALATKQIAIKLYNQVKYYIFMQKNTLHIKVGIQERDRIQGKSKYLQRSSRFDYWEKRIWRRPTSRRSCWPYQERTSVEHPRSSQT